MKELPENIVEMNRKLTSNYGYVGVQSRFRLVWSNDMLEKRRGKFTKVSDAGLILGEEFGVKEVPKYQHFKDKYVLEILIPNFSTELIDKLSYEPLWVFGKGGDPNGDSVPPTWNVIQFIVSCWFQRDTKKPIQIDTSDTPEEKLKRVQQLELELFGNETATGDALAHKQAIVVPENFEVQ